MTSTTRGTSCRPAPHLLVTPYEIGDEHGIVDLFNRVFGAGRSDFVPRSIAEWNWEFRDCPAGMQIMLGKDHDTGRVVAHYAAVPVRFNVEGEDVLVGQPVDSMVDPQWRRTHATPNAFLATARHYYETWGNAGHCHATYGFPNHQARVIGQRHLGYISMFAPVQTLFANLFEPGPWTGMGRHRCSELVVEEVRRFDARVDVLWSAVRSSYDVAAIRDATYLNWRYADAPVPYRLFVVRDRSASPLRAIFVLRHGWCAPSILAIADLLTHPADRDALAACLLTAIETAGAQEQGRVEMWLPAGHRLFATALELGMQTEPSPMTCVGRFYFTEHDLGWYLRHWYYTIGDSDLL
ncbi:MAG: GNAT family N-acetyltransferase [Planctomycetota bacterium]